MFLFFSQPKRIFLTRKLFISKDAVYQSFLSEKCESVCNHHKSCVMGVDRMGRRFDSSNIRVSKGNPFID